MEMSPALLLSSQLGRVEGYNVALVTVQPTAFCHSSRDATNSCCLNYVFLYSSQISLSFCYHEQNAFILAGLKMPTKKRKCDGFCFFLMNRSSDWQGCLFQAYGEFRNKGWSWHTKSVEKRNWGRANHSLLYHVPNTVQTSCLQLWNWMAHGWVQTLWKWPSHALTHNPQCPQPLWF